MKHTMKLATRRRPPQPKNGRRERGTGKLSLHVGRGGDGLAVPYRMDGKKALWKFTYRHPDDRCRSFAAHDWDDAERLSVLVAQELEKGATAPAPTHTMDQLCDHFLEVRSGQDSSTRQGTVEGYRRDLKQFVRPHFAAMAVEAVTPEDVDRWKAKYAAEGKARTRQKRVNLLASLFHLAVNEGWRNSSPVLDRHRVRVLKQGERDGKLKGDQRVARVLAMEEVERIVGDLDPEDPALRLLVRLTARMGFRLREVTHVRVEDVTFLPDGSAFIAVASGIACTCRDCRGNDGTRLTKAGKARLAPIPPDLVDAVRSFLEARRARFGPRGWLFPVWRGKPRQRTRPGQLRVAHVVSGAFIAAAPPGVVFHDLRATAKTHLLLSGANPTAVDVALGHALPGMSGIYVQLSEQPALLYRGCFPAWKPTLAVVKEKAS